MFSVTERAEYVIQPRGGYISPRKFIEKNYVDGEKIEELSESFYDSVQGMAVDYLTRFVCGTPKHIAFDVSLKGAEIIGESDEAEELLKKINGLDRQSIICACKLVCYDVHFRKDNYSLIKYGITVYEEMINNIIIMVKRSVLFFEQNGPIVLDGFTFSRAYNDMVCRGDGDFLTKDTLWDLKAIKKAPNKNHTLQILIYYILGLHTTYPEFNSIKKLGIFNPRLNTSYEIYLSDIDDVIFQKVSRDVIGYCTPDDAKLWRNAYGISKEALKEIENIKANQCVDTAFSPDNYDDGIHDITIDDYWTYCRKIFGGERPKFSWIDSVKLVKNSGFFMFVAITKKGELRLLKKGDKRVLYDTLQYYYINLPAYGNSILNIFSKYWDTLYKVSKFLKSINFVEDDLRKFCDQKISDVNKREEVFNCLKFKKQISHDFYGTVHGCIVDIDFNNHIFINPNDGAIVPYYSISKDNIPELYTNLRELIAKRRTEMLPAFLKYINEYGDSEISLLLDSNNKRTIPFVTDKSISVINEDYEVNEENLFAKKMMYSYSRKIREIQSIYDHHLVQVWYDDILFYKKRIT